MNASQLRQQIFEAGKLFNLHLRTIMGHKELMRGGVYRLRRKCGKPGCRCTRGYLHESWVHLVREDGKQRMRTLPKGKIARWRALADQYRRFRSARRELKRQYDKILLLVDQLEDARAVLPPMRQKEDTDASFNCIRGK